MSHLKVWLSHLDLLVGGVQFEIRLPTALIDKMRGFSPYFQVNASIMLYINLLAPEFYI